MSTVPQKPTKNSADDTSHLGISFHEIQSDELHEAVTAHASEATLPKAVTPKKSHLSHHEDVFDVSKAFDAAAVEHGTIVTDRRHSRPTLGENLQSAFVEWWGKTKKSITALESIQVAAPVKEPEIQKAETRTEIIKEAATYTAQIPKDDHAVVIEKIKTYNRDVAKVTGKSFVIKQPEKKLSAWVHTAERHELTPKNVKVFSTMRVTTPDMRASMVAPVVEKKVTEVVHTPSKISEHIPSVSVQKFEEKLVPKKAKTVPSQAFSVAPIVQKPVRVATPVPTPTVRDMVFPIPAPVQKSIPVSHPAEKAVVPEVVLEPVKPRIEAAEKPMIATVFEKEEVAVSVPEKVFRTEAVPVTPVAPTAVEAPIVLVQDQLNTDSTPSDPPKSVLSNLATLSTNVSLRIITRWVILAGIIILGGILAIVVSLYFNVFSKSPEQSSETVPVLSFMEVGSQLPVELTLPRETFLESVRALVSNATSPLTQIYPIIQHGSASHQATSAEILTFLNTRLGSKAVRALDDTFMIGSITTSKPEPFIIMRSYNFDVLFAGLLAWEPYMYTDLEQLFGSEGIPAARFVDAVGNNASIRILHDLEGNEILLYSFINQNTVIMTTSGEALAKLIQYF